MDELHAAHPNRVAWLDDYTDYLSKRRRRRISANSIRHYRSVLDTLWSWWATAGDGDPATLTEDAFLAYLDLPVARTRPRIGPGRPWPNSTGAPGRSPKTQADYTSIAQNCYAWAQRTGRISIDPLADLPLPEVPEAVERDLTPAELDLLMDDARTYLGPRGLRYRAVIEGMYYGAFRGHELDGALLQNLHLDGDPQLYVLGKGSRGRWVNLHPVFVATLRELIATYDDPTQGPLIQDLDHPGEPITVGHLRKEINSRLKQVLGRRWTAHGLRHCGLTDLLANGETIEVVAEHAGHKSLETTRRYTKGAIRRETVAAVRRMPARGTRPPAGRPQARAEQPWRPSDPASPVFTPTGRRRRPSMSPDRRARDRRKRR